MIKKQNDSSICILKQRFNSIIKPISYSMILLFFLFQHSLTAQNISSGTKCKADLVPDMDCSISFKGKKYPLVKSGKKQTVVLDFGENLIIAELPIIQPTSDKNKKAITCTTKVSVRDTTKKTVLIEFLGKEKFIDYIKENKIDLVEQSLKKHLEFADNKKNDFEIFPITIAAEKGYHEILKLLLDKGANPNPNPSSDISLPPLHAALINGKTECVKILLERGAKVNAKDPAGWTALHFAATLGKTEWVNQLLEKGADVNAKTDNGETALRLALDKGRETIAEILKQKGGIE